MAFADLGEQAVKNIARAVGVFGLTARDIAAIPESAIPSSAEDITPAIRHEQEIHFCQTADGVQLAYARVGQGPPLVKTGHWMTHIEFDLESPIWRHLYRELSRDHSFIRYDARGNGLSDREVPELTFEKFVDDLEAVVDAAGIDRFALLGISQGCAVSIAYAVRHPERVSHLVLLGGYAVGWKKRAKTEAEKQAGDAMLTLMRVGWGQENPAFRQMFTSQFIPGANKEQADWFNEFQRISSSAADAARNLLANGEADVSSLLSQVKVPTLVMHCRQDARVPFESGRRMAAGIPGARFVPLESQNHVMLEGEPALARFLEELRSFLGADVRH
jgi:pimeloyl-ACP methyl ester carboxylesterase